MCYSQKKKKVQIHPTISLNNIQVERASHHKHLVILLDEKLNFNQPQNESFCEKLESVQYKAALAITGAIQGTSRDNIYQELGLESLKSRRWYKRLRGSS